MKSVFYFSVLSIVLISRKKGEKMPNEIVVQFITLDNSGVSPEEDFTTYDYDLFGQNETKHSPNYAHDYSPQEIATRFNSKLTEYLHKNNIMLQANPAEYVLVITGMNLTETLKRESYVDSCTINNPINYVYYSSLRFSIKAELYKNAILLASFC